MEKAIEIQHVKKVYKLYQNPQDRFKEAVSIRKKVMHTDFYALDDVSLEVFKGETVGIVGTNGSGKSTLLKIITGVLKATAGEVKVQGKISALLELGAGFNQEYTGIQNIYLNGRMMGYTRKQMDQKVDEIIEFAEIGDFINQPVKTYSSGMFARLAFAVAINVEPDILIVDEALSVGDLFFQNKCFKKFDELKKKGVTILFVSHDISSVRQMCSRVLWIEKGKQMIFDQSDKVCDMYMDKKRMDMNTLVKDGNRDTRQLSGKRETGKVTFPAINYKESAIVSPDIQIVSVFITDADGEMTSSMEVDREYCFHVVISSEKDYENLIVGIVAENNKGIPLYDFNNYINAEKVITLEKDSINEIEFHFTLPRIMKGRYVIAAAIAQGTQQNHQMLTWLHGIFEIEIINNGYNSSYIEIPATVKMNIFSRDNVSIGE